MNPTKIKIKNKNLEKESSLSKKDDIIYNIIFSEGLIMDGVLKIGIIFLGILVGLVIFLAIIFNPILDASWASQKDTIGMYAGGKRKSKWGILGLLLFLFFVTR